VVYSDAAASVVELPHPQRLFTVGSGGGCLAAQRSVDRVGLICHSPATIVRHELYMAGWSATVNSQPVPVHRDGAFESVRVPKGPLVLRFSFAPPYLNQALAAFGVALLLLVPLPLLLRRRPSAAGDAFRRLRALFDRGR